MINTSNATQTPTERRNDNTRQLIAITSRINEAVQENDYELCIDPNLPMAIYQDLQTKQGLLTVIDMLLGFLESAKDE